MRIHLWICLAGTLGSLCGCGEFISTGERTSAVDVVGEPTDPVPESMEQSEILGSSLQSLPSLNDEDEFAEPDDMAMEISNRDNPKLAIDLQPVSGQIDSLKPSDAVTKPVSLKSKRSKP